VSKNVSEIKEFWDNRAKTYGSDWKATLGEKYLRMLEIKTMKNYIRRFSPNIVYDVGCGNGYSTLVFAQQFPDISFVGIDYSVEMITIAKKNRTPNCKFMVGDVLESDSIPSEKADLIVTQRCLQNLPDYTSQKVAISNLLSKLSKNGVLLLMECSKDGVYQLNKTRNLIFKNPIENIEPWHNRFFIDTDIINDFSAQVIYFSSTYMFISKVIHPIFSSLGYLLPNIGRFGYDRLYLIKKEQ